MQAIDFNYFYFTQALAINISPIFNLFEHYAAGSQWDLESAFQNS